MKTKEKKEFREKTIQELQKALKQFREEFLSMVFEHDRGKLKNTSLLLHKRKDIARIKSILQEKAKS